MIARPGYQKSSQATDHNYMDMKSKTILLFVYVLNCIVGRDSSVGIATRYGLDGPGIESRWWRDFPQPFRPALGPNQPPVKRLPCLFPRGKAAGAWR